MRRSAARHRRNGCPPHQWMQRERRGDRALVGRRVAVDRRGIRPARSSAEKDVDVGGRTLYLRCWGAKVSGEPSVLLLSGSGPDDVVLGAHGRRLRRGRSPPLRLRSAGGRAQRRRDESPRTTKDQVDDLLALLDAADLQEARRPGGPLAGLSSCGRPGGPRAGAGRRDRADRAVVATGERRASGAALPPEKPDESPELAEERGSSTTCSRPGPEPRAPRCWPRTTRLQSGCSTLPDRSSGTSGRGCSTGHRRRTSRAPPPVPPSERRRHQGRSAGVGYRVDGGHAHTGSTTPDTTSRSTGPRSSRPRSSTSWADSRPTRAAIRGCRNVENGPAAPSPDQGPSRTHGRMAVMSHIKQFDHVGITVTDLDSVTAFFAGLGLEVEGRASLEGDFIDEVIGIPDSKSEIVVLRPPGGGTGVELARFVRPEHQPGSPTAMATELGLCGICLVIEASRGGRRSGREGVRTGRRDRSALDHLADGARARSRRDRRLPDRADRLRRRSADTIHGATGLASRRRLAWAAGCHSRRGVGRLAGGRLVGGRLVGGRLRPGGWGSGPRVRPSRWVAL